ncbi:MAG: hypothetical protein HHAS10_04270 [Candidatus Altimarinota bacterium]
MINSINTFLTPVEKFLKQKSKYISYFLIFLSIFALVFYIIPFISISNGNIGFTNSSSIAGMQKESGEQALNVLWIILWIPIFARVLQIRVTQNLMPLRKELGILMGVLAFIHGGMYIFPYSSELGTKGFWITDGFFSYLAFGFFAFILTIPLLLTSNNWAMRLLGRKWKLLHRAVYFILIFTIAHVVLLKWYLHLEIIPVILLFAYMIGKYFEWSSKTIGGKQEKGIINAGQKWLCVPCGYIYDPSIGDIDSGIKPGTEFVDIPDDWSCPLCGVKKSDFIPYNEDEEEATSIALVKEKKMLNATTVELTIETEENHSSKAGQFMSFLWKDKEGQFPRSYSIAHHEGNQFTFLIKLSLEGRGAKCIRDCEEGDIVRIRNIAGGFILQDTSLEKIFIATGTGLAPIYRMIQEDNKRATPSKKTLYFSVSTKDELFYQSQLEAIENLNLNIHITREKIDGFHFSRVNVESIDAPKETEWYLCGNPKMVSETRTTLLSKGYKNVYSEEF